ncbi:MAG: WYL domain-containing protein [Clostridium lundense]|nr:WYL domain-containing protein [Clostridium lundense]
MDAYYDSRQHLNLSQLAYDVIESDKYEFLEKPSRQRLINMIIAAYADDADAAIDNAVTRYRENLEARLASVGKGQGKEMAVSSLVDSYRRELLKKTTDYPKECAFKIQLDRENYSAMLEWRDDSGYYNSTPGKFYKAVIEEYARKTYYEREGILLRCLIGEIQTCIDSQQLIIVTINGTKRNRYEVRPYSICHDAGHNYHYLIGYSRKAGTAYDERPVSFRISRIQAVKQSHARSGKITKPQKDEIERKLKTEGVQFLLQDAEDICIKLSAPGKKLYEATAHLRPLFTQRTKCEDNRWLYTFNCTQLQAEFYFFKFGADAEIIQPSDLREKFKDKYKKAVEQYLQSDCGSLSTDSK